MPITGPDMKLPQEITFLLEGPPQAGELLDSLASRFMVEETGKISGQKYYYDTFDWRLFRKSFVLTVTGNRLELSDFNGVSIGVSAGLPRKNYFCWDIQESELREPLEAIIDMRALIQIFSLNFAERTFRVLNKDRKTVARIVLRDEKARGEGAQLDLPRRLSLQEIRGYGSVFDKIRKMCLKTGLKSIDDEQDLLKLAFSVSERKLLDYGAKFRVDLDETITIGEAVSKICLDLAGAMQINHVGVCADIDSEFLHDFRIAIRRTRSLLTLLKKVLPPEKTSYFQSEFKWLGSVTGPVRDIDVYLLKRKEYLGMLPESLHSGLSLFFDELEKMRIREIKLLRRHLASPRYRTLLESWRLYLSEPGSEIFSTIRKKKCKPLADKLIGKRFAGFLRDGDKINESSADNELHKLRIRGKKLRYLLEFFRSFYDEAEMERFLKQMKRLQDNLGDFNDLSVQQEMLALRLAELSGRTQRTMQLGASLGGLISVLAGKHRSVRQAFQKSYSNFSKTGNRDLLDTVISASSRRVS